MKKFLILSSLLLFSAACVNRNESHLRVWYDKPADATVPDTKNSWQNDPEWLKAMPVGNGYLGAMIFGDVSTERIQLNEKSLWSGSPDDNDNPDAINSLDKIRRLLFEGRYREATELTLLSQVCKGSGSGNGNGADVPFGCYQTLGDLRIDFGKEVSYADYHRELDLEKGVVRISYRIGNVKYNREVFASYPDRALIIRLKADKKKALSFIVTMNRPERSQTSAQDDNLMMYGVLSNGKGGDGLNYAARLKVTATDGKVTYSGNSAELSQGSEAIIILTAATNYSQNHPLFRGDDPLTITRGQMDAVSGLPFREIYRRHTEDFSSLFSRVSLKLAYDMQDTMTTDERLRNSDDLHLQELYFQYGRYLLISSSREGSLPSNLQGIWANKIQTPWNCDYHTNINVQMNYWPSDMTNLSECHEPLTKFIESVVEPGRRTARIQYNTEGWCIHPVTNVWGFTAPGEHPSWGLHVGAGGWLCQHLWDHFAFTLDTAYLERVYPVMLESARFYLDWLVKDPSTGRLVSGPASSPENTFIAPDGSIAQVSMGPSHDQQIIHELFSNVLRAGKLLSDDDTLLVSIDSALNELDMPGIGSDGRIMEWREEFREVEPAHRHVSHLYMLHPGNVIDPQKTPELAEAARKSLEARTDNGTGWSLAWKVNLWARLHDGERAYRLLKNVLRPIDPGNTSISNAGGTYGNLFCGHPPFQIDGNFGATSGIGEMLLQSHVPEDDTWIINLLPALPSAWPEGEVKGLRARGGFEVSMKWSNGLLVSCEIKSVSGKKLRVKYNDREFSSEISPGDIYILSEDLILKKRKHNGI